MIEGPDMWVQIFADLIFTWWLFCLLAMQVNTWWMCWCFLFPCDPFFTVGGLNFSPRRWIDSWQTLWQTVVGIGAKFTEEKGVPPRSCWAHGGLLLWLWLSGISVLLKPTRSMWGSLIPSCTVSVACSPFYGEDVQFVWCSITGFEGGKGGCWRTVRDLIILGQAFSVKVHTLLKM